MWSIFKTAHLLLVILIFIGLGLSAQKKLTPNASVSLLTCGNGDDLYSIFGHTAIRVKDKDQNIDAVFNYGTFQFSDDFPILFAMGKLNYQLSIESFEGFKNGYVYQNRWVVEQVLNLNEIEKQKVFDFLQNNYLPKNREYLYDFFYDNCSTRPRDVIEFALGDKLEYNFATPESDTTFKLMLDLYLGNTQWVDAGMDLGLGKTAEIVLTEREKMFLPDYVMRNYNRATIKRNETSVPLVGQQNLVVESVPFKTKFYWYQPAYIFWTVFVLFLLVFFIPFTRKAIVTLDFLLYFLTGLAGWLIMFLWFITDHTTTQVNFDILWALPVFIPLCFSVFFKKQGVWLKRFFLFAAILNMALLVFWPFLPQNLNEVFLPVIFLLLWRNLHYSGVRISD